MLITIDVNGAQSLFDQVAASIRGDIVAGRLSSGDRLPPAREVADALDINLHTVLRAYQQLRDEGLIDLRRGRGATVAASAAPLAALSGEISALVTRAASLGLTPATLAAIIKETTA